MSALLLVAFATLSAVGMTGLLMLRGGQRAELQASRIEAVIAPHRSTGADALPTLDISRAREVPNLRAMLLGLLKYEPKRSIYYRMSLPMLLSIAGFLGLLLGFAGSRFIGAIGWLAFPLGWIWIARAYHAWCDDRTQRALYVQFPEALATIVRVVRVGLPVVEAIRVVARENPAPTSVEFGALAEQTAIGVPFDEALRDMASRNGLPEYRFFATALSLQSQTGGSLTETLENLADTIRKRVQTRLKGHALAAEARMSAYILGALPIFTGVMLAIFNHRYIAVLFTDPTGRKLLYAGIILLGIGAWSMRSIIRRSLT